MKNIFGRKHFGVGMLEMKNISVINVKCQKSASINKIQDFPQEFSRYTKVLKFIYE